MAQAILPEDTLRQICQGLRLIADGFNRAERYGEPIDSPEGARYIKLSDTLARAMAQRLIEVCDALEHCLEAHDDE